MLRYLLHRPIGVSMSLMTVLILGVFALLKIPSGLMPEAEVPRLQVEVSIPSGSSAFIEQSTLQPLRVAFQGLYGLTDIESISGSGSGQITLTFAYETDMQLAYLQTQEKIDQQLNYLPEIDRPLVRRMLQTDIPIVRLQVTSDQLDRVALSQVTTSIIKRRIEQLKGVGMVGINGQVKPMVRLTFRSDIMQSLGIKSESIIQTVKTANFQLSQLKVTEGNYEYDLTFDPLLSSTSEIGELLLIGNDVRPVRLKEVVTVSSTFQEPAGEHLVNGHLGLVLAIHKQHGADQQEIDRTIRQTLEQLRTELPAVQFDLSQNQTEVLQASLGQLLGTLLLGSLLAAVIIAMFSAHWKPPLLMFILIPVAMIFTVGILYAAGLTLNIISLSGMILGVGILIDNGIIMIENIQSKRENLSLIEACLIGANEIMPALISSTLTTLAVFLPLIVLEGIAGTLFKEQIISLAVVLFASLLAAYLLLPLAYVLLNPPNKKDNTWMMWLLEQYHWTQRHIGARVWMTVFGVLFLSGIFSYYQIDKSQLPEIETSDARIDITWGRSFSLPQQRAFFKDLFGDRAGVTFWEVDYGKNMIFEPGMNDNTHALVYLRFENQQLKEKHLPLILWRVSEQDAMAVVEVTRAKNPYDQLFADDQVLLRAKLNNQGQDIVLADSLVSKVFKEWEAEAGFLSSQGYQLVLKQDRLQRLGIAPSVVLQEVQQVLADQWVTTVNEISESTPIYIRSGPISSLQELEKIRLTANDSATVSLGTLIDMQPVELLRYLTHDESGRYQSLSLNRLSVNIEKTIDDIGQIARSKGWMIQWEGSYFEQRASIQYMVFAFGLAVILLYVILAAQFESVRLPLIILAEIPISLAGAIMMLWITNESINLSSLMGMVIMLGIIINDSILKVDTMRRYQKAGLAIHEAIHKAGQDRLKPILMTSLTTILALVPVLVGTGLGADLQAPLAISVIGGLLIGTICSIYLIPILYRKLV